MKVSVTKDRKGSCWIVSHLRCGYHEQIFLTEEELVELYHELKKIV